ncbi:sensor histidine kinase [Kitasatospora sp. NA04385]|uniref:sensor histidine kinase n=1 Tax=Kitasatospora sp. NA04385 TaxID=2742135 RepID=UPI001592AC53|nr:histidine kinase [Kitasatospora sp. NA04385]QKW23649.1 sensor histidine kinase [Kitasatospora sp. NA04385]
MTTDPTGTARPVAVVRRLAHRCADLSARRPWLPDAALGAGLTAFDVLTLLARHPAPGAAGTVLWGAQTVPLLWRRHRPVAVLAAMTAAFVLFTATDPVPGKTPGPYLLVLGVYAAARYAPATRSAPATALALATAVATDLLCGRALPAHLGSVEPISATTYAVFLTTAWFLGRGRRRIGAQAGRLRLLNARLRAERETNARQAVLTERARIARDLHDVVAHHISAIALQARATGEALAEERAAPGDGRPGVERIARTADTALVEMRRILGLLAPVDGTDDLAPEPSLADLHRLASVLEAAGCRVTAAVDDDLGAPGALPAAARLSAYRIAREALTNALKHAGPTWVRIEVRRSGDTLTLLVENGPAPSGHRPVPGSGRGLLGIRERVAAFDGTLHAGPRDGGGWRLSAALPLRSEPEPPPDLPSGDLDPAAGAMT